MKKNITLTEEQSEKIIQYYSGEGFTAEIEVDTSRVVQKDTLNNAIVFSISVAEALKIVSEV